MSTASTIPVFLNYMAKSAVGRRRICCIVNLFLQRSSLYEWHIRVHQHAEMVQLLYLHKGRAEIEVEGATRVMTEACIQVVPALCIHGFRFFPPVLRDLSCRFHCRC